MTTTVPKDDPRSSAQWKRIRAEILDESDICWICKHPGANSIDHVIPVKLGGAMFDPANLRPAHLRCNQKKGVKPGAQLRNPTSRRW